MNTRLERAIQVRFPEVKHIYLEVARAAPAGTPAEVPELETKSAVAAVSHGQKPQVMARPDGKKGRAKRRR